MQDIGKLISDELIRQERTPAWLASKGGEAEIPAGTIVQNMMTNNEVTIK